MKQPLQLTNSKQQLPDIMKKLDLIKPLLTMFFVSVFTVTFHSDLDAQEPTASVFLPAPRVVKQHLTRAKKAIDEGQFSDAVSHLGTILTETFDEEVPPGTTPDAARGDIDENQDYFVELEESPGTFVSLKGEAQRLLGSLPSNALELYELQYGTEATQILNSALESGKLSQLTEVTRKYFHTQAGYESAILLAYQDLSLIHI